MKRAAILLIYLLTASAAMAASEPDKLGFSVIDSRPHPNLAFTQGLLIHQGQFYESSGLYGKSFVQAYDVDDPKAKAKVNHLPKTDFAEGLAYADQHLWLLTWRQGIAKKIDPASLRTVAIETNQSEGWGLTSDGQALIASDGTATLSWRNATNFNLLRQQQVTLAGKPLYSLNELEFAKHHIWANVWFDNRIFAIDPHSHEVVAYLDLQSVVTQESQFHRNGMERDAVLNGIAWDEQRQGFWVTGKRWRKMYLIQAASWPKAANN